MKHAKRISTLAILALLGLQGSVVQAGIFSGGSGGGLSLCPNIG